MDTVKVKRDVEVYQWVENVTESKSNKGGGGNKKSYTYTQEWKDEPIS